MPVSKVKGTSWAQEVNGERILEERRMIMEWRERVRICFMTALVTSVILFLPLIAFAGGTNNEPLGIEDYLIGVAPPPSIAGKVYLSWYTASTQKDNNGNNVHLGSGARLDKVNVFVESNRVLFITPLKFNLGGFDGFVNGHMVFPFVKPNVHVDAGAPGLPAPIQVVNASPSGLADITFGPGIAWHHKSGFLHGITAVDIIAPTAQWNPYRPVNVGHNVWAVAPVLIFTVFPPFYPDIDISIKFDYTFNGTNDAYIGPSGFRTHISYGNEFHFDYDIEHAIWGGKPGMQLRGGVAGYFYQQTTKDDVHDPLFTDHLGRVFAIGPAVMFDYKMWIFSAHVYWETAAQNRSQGITTQLTILCKF